MPVSRDTPATQTTAPSIAPGNAQGNAQAAVQPVTLPAAQTTVQPAVHTAAPTTAQTTVQPAVHTATPTTVQTIEEAIAQLNDLREVNTSLENALFLELNKTQKLQDTLTGCQHDLALSQEETDQSLSQVATLSVRLRELEQRLAEFPEIEILQKTLSETQAENIQLNEALERAREQLGSIIQDDAPVSDGEPLPPKEKLALEQRILELETLIGHLRGIHATTQTPAKTTDCSSAGSLTADDTFFFYEVFSLLQMRLAHSPENKDVLEKAEQSLQLLEKTRSVEAIPCLGQIFDPNLHKVFKAYSTSILQDETIVEGFSPGFKVGNRVMRRAQVGIAKSEFHCLDCKSKARPHELFCAHCGLEICAPDGTSKRGLPPLPTAPEFCAPVIKALLALQQHQQAQRLYLYCAKDHQQHPALQQQDLQHQLGQTPSFAED